MADPRDAMDQVEHSALQQLVILGMATQSLRPRLDADGVTLEESVILGQMLAGLSNLMLEWTKMLFGDEDPCESCTESVRREDSGPA